jgi:hypothetical protein
MLTLSPAIYASFNNNYGPRQNQQHNGDVGYAAFNQTYHANYVRIPQIQYGGNREFSKIISPFSARLY